MSTLYRSTWSDNYADNGPSILKNLQCEISKWIYGSSTAIPLESEANIGNKGNGLQRSYRMATLDSAGFSIKVVDKGEDGTVWNTDIKVIVRDETIHVLVENGMESDDIAQRLSLGRPRIVRSLLNSFKKPSLGPTSLQINPVAIPSNGVDILVDILVDNNRQLPVIVCTEPEYGASKRWLNTAKSIANRVQGIAVVFTLNRNATREFHDQLGDLAAWDGTVRVYAPGRVDSNSDAWMHRYYLNSKFENSHNATVDKIINSVAQLSARRRIPGIFNAFSINDIAASTKDLDAEREQWEFDLEIAQEEQGNLAKEISKLNGHLARLKEELIEHGLVDLLWGTQQESESSIPDEVQDTSEAVIAAQVYLRNWLTVPDTAPQELAAIDTTATSYAWGNRTWQGLRALAAYAEDRSAGWNKGGFWEWCSSGPILGWPATTKKLSMTESSTVQNSDKLAQKRVFDVDKSLSESGKISMLSHLKIAEGGGDLAPRVYFYDDTGGTTKKVHIGLVGPHYLVPNKSTN